ncbi:MAG: hypothetical protein AAF849_03225 [Bacteroidota bacterium]
MSKNTRPTRTPDSMLESHFMQLFLALNASEGNLQLAFIKYAKSRCRSKEPLIKLLAYCKENVQEQNTAAKCWNKVRAYNIAIRTPKFTRKDKTKVELLKKGRINNLLHELNQILQEFMLLKYIESSEFDKNYMLAKIYEQYNLTSLFHGKVNETKSSLIGLSRRDEWWYLSMFKIEYLKYFHIETPKTKPLGPLLIQMHKYIIAFAQKIQSQLETEYYSLTKESMLEEINKETKAYLEKVQQLSMKPNFDEYLALKEQFEDQLTVHSKPDAQKLLAGMMNAAARLDNLKYREKLADIYFFYSTANRLGKVSLVELNSNVVINLMLFLLESQQQQQARSLLDKYYEINKDDKLKRIIDSIIIFYENKFEESYYAFLEVKGRDQYEESLCLSYLLLSFLCLACRNKKADLRKIKYRLENNDHLKEAYYDRIRDLFEVVRKAKNPSVKASDLESLINKTDHLPMKDWLEKNIDLRNTDN